MIEVIQGFKLSTRDAVDNRLLLSKAEMLLINDNQMPDRYFTVCKDDGTLYLYDKSATPSAETGKFSQFSASKIASISVNGEELPIENFNVDLPLATAERYGMMMLGKGLVSADDGSVTLNFNAIDDASIPVEKINWEDSVIDAGNI